MKHNYIKSRQHRHRRIHLRHFSYQFDWVLLFVTVVLLIIGVLMVYEASVVDAYNQFNDKFYFVKNQTQWAVLGLLSLGFCIFIPINLIRKIALPLFVVSIIPLILVLFPALGTKVGGARRWLDLGIISFQPSELIKLTLVFYFAALLEKTVKTLPFLISLAMISLLVMLQPDLGTTIIICATGFTLFYLAGANFLHLFFLLISGLIAGTILILSSPYRTARLITFFNPETDPLGSSYHIRQVILALGSGGFLGQGIGRSLQKFQYLPEATTDSIFAVIAEETGFVGTLAITSLFSIYIFRGFQIANRQLHPFPKLVALGLTFLIAAQVLLNLSAMAALVPLTGITLPFISYGGSSLVVTLIATGLLLNLSRRN